MLADWIRRETEQLAATVGSSIGGLLNVSFGSLAELILAFFVLAAGEVDVACAQITGSILGTSLFGLGLTIVVGSIERSKQHFNRAKAGQLASMRFCRDSAMRRSISTRLAAIRMPVNRTDWLLTKFGL